MTTLIKDNKVFKTGLGLTKKHNHVGQAASSQGRLSKQYW